MKIVIASDSFKESMTAFEACEAMKKGIHAVDSQVDCVCIPMSDGGEGTVDVLLKTTHSKIRMVEVHNSFHEKISVSYGIDSTGSVIMECAAAVGIDLIPIEKRNPTIALSTGLGEMILDALEQGANQIIIGLGGSGTNDGGFGLLYALGAKFYDKNMNELPLSMDSVLKIESMDLSEAISKFEKCKLIVASDVDNVYTGNQGATYVFGRQKGASDSQLDYLESCLCHLQEIIKNQYGVDLSAIKKSGAAGGLGGALYLLGAKMMSGIEMVLNVTDFEDKIKGADFIFTGEGSIDEQTINGKTISGISKLGKKHNIPVIAFAGRVTKGAQNLYDHGVTAMFSITNEAKSLEQALLDGTDSLTSTTKNVFKLIKEL